VHTAKDSTDSTIHIPFESTPQEQHTMYIASTNIYKRDLWQL